MAQYISGNIKGLAGVRCDLVSQATGLRIESTHSIWGGVWKFSKPTPGLYDIKFYGRDVLESDWLLNYEVHQDDPYLGGEVTYAFWNGVVPYADSKIVKENEFGWFNHSQLKFHIDAEGNSPVINIEAINYRIFYNGSWTAWTADPNVGDDVTHSLDIDIAGLSNIDGENNILEFYVTFVDGTQDMVTTIPFKYDSNVPTFNITAGAAVGGFNRIGLDWTNVDVSDTLSEIGYIVIYRDTNSSFSGAVEIARLVVVDQSVIPSSYIDNTMPTNDQATKYFYWGKAMDRAGNLSAEARLDTAALGTSIVLLLPADVDGALRIQNNPVGVNWEVIYGIHVPIQAVIITAGTLANVSAITAIQYKADDADTWHDVPTPKYNGQTISYPRSIVGMAEGETLTFLYTTVIQDMKYHRVVFDHADAETEIAMVHFESILAADIIVGGVLRLEKGLSIWTGSFDANGNVTGAGMFIDKLGLQMWDAAGSINQRLNNDGSATFGKTGVAQITIGTNGVVSIDSSLLVITSATTFQAGYDPASMRQVFTSQPAPPYYVDDLWMDGTDIFITDTQRVPPATFNAGDWSLATDYDNSGDKSTRWYAPSTSDPSSGWTTQEKIDHIGDQWVKTDLGNKLFSWEGTIWIQDYTEIDGGHIDTYSISAEKLAIGAVSWTTDIIFEPDDSTSLGYMYLKWNSGSIKFSSGEIRTTIPLGTLKAVSSPRSWAYHNEATNTILLTATYSDAVGVGKTLLAIVDRGDVGGLCIINPIFNTGTTIDGDKVVTGKISSINGNTYFDLINNEIVMADGSITGVVVIDSSLLNITATTTFSPGYDPSTKSQHFTVEPTTPYWDGDFWTDGTDLKRCNNTRLSGAYVAGDWILATDYTNDDLAQDALAIADLQIVGFFQDLAPSGAGESFGDIWIDTDDSPVDSSSIYRYEDVSGGSQGALAWRAASTSAIGLVYLDAYLAQTTADTKIVTFFQANNLPTSPVGDEGDLWINSDDNNKMYRAASDGSDAITAGEWELARDTDILQALTDAADALAIADGEIVGYYQASNPGVKSFGDIWIDTTGGNPNTSDIYRYEDVSGGSSGALAWRLASTNAIGLAYLKAYDAQTTADGKIVTFYQDDTPAPTTMEEGDFWVDATDGLNILKRYNGATWDVVTDKTYDQNIRWLALAANDPSSGWTAQEKIDHTGDQWVKTDLGNQIWSWTGSAWVQDYTKIDGNHITTGKISSYDGYTYFDLINNIIKLHKTIDRVTIGDFGGGNFGIKAYDASGNLLLKIDDSTQLIQSADGYTYFDLKNQYLRIVKSVERLRIGEFGTSEYGIEIKDASSNILIKVTDITQIIQSVDQKTYFDLSNATIRLTHPTTNIYTYLTPAKMYRTYDNNTTKHDIAPLIDYDFTANSSGGYTVVLFNYASGFDLLKIGGVSSADGYARYQKLALVNLYEIPKTGGVPDEYRWRTMESTRITFPATGNVNLVIPSGTFTNSIDCRAHFTINDHF